MALQKTAPDHKPLDDGITLAWMREPMMEPMNIPKEVVNISASWEIIEVLAFTPALLALLLLRMLPSAG